jgi:hypothetical protein
MFKRLGYGLQADKKTLTVSLPHKDPDALFEQSNGEYKKAATNGAVVLSINAEKKES